MELDKYRICISGLNLHHALEYFEREHFTLQDLVRGEKNQLFVTLYKSDFKKFKAENFAKTYKIKIIEKIGKDKIFTKILRRIGLILGVALSLYIVISTTNHVHKVEILSLNHVCSNNQECIFYGENKNKLIEALAEYGVKEGTKLPLRISSREVERELMKKFKQISGVTIKQHGLNLQVEIIEATLPQTQTSNDLLCPVNGIVISCDVSEGESKVKIGDIVLKDQTLAKCIGNRPVTATYTIRTFYHENLVYSNTQTSYVQTGRTKRQTQLEIFGKTFSSQNKHSFKLFKSQTNSRYAFFNLFFPLKIQTTTYYELEKVEQIVEFETVQDSLKNKLYEEAKLLIDKNAEEKNVTYATLKEGDRTRLDCYIECYITVKT